MKYLTRNLLGAGAFALASGPVLAHSGHPELAGAQGHAMAHIAMAAAALAVAWGLVSAFKTWRQKQEG